MSMEPIVALEIGTSRVRVFVGEAREDGGLMITAVGESASSGMRKGEMFHFESVCACVETALRQAEEAANLTINEVYLAMSGSQIEGMPNRGEIAVDGEIEQEHVDQVLRAAKEVTLPADRQILHSILGQFCVDGLSGVMPVGMVGKTLSADVLIVHGVYARMINLVRVVKSLKLDVAELLFSGLCSAMAALSAEQKLQGADPRGDPQGPTDPAVSLGCGGPGPQHRPDHAPRRQNQPHRQVHHPRPEEEGQARQGVAPHQHGAGAVAAGQVLSPRHHQGPGEEQPHPRLEEPPVGPHQEEGPEDGPPGPGHPVRGLPQGGAKHQGGPQ